MNEYEFPPHRHEHDFSGPASRKIGELFARVQDFIAKPELAIYSQHTVDPPYTLKSTSCECGIAGNSGKNESGGNVNLPILAEKPATSLH
jgi:hypothetical protein